MSITRDEEYALFDSAIQRIAESNTLMVNTNFETLIKLIAYDPAIRLCVSDCYKSIDYERLLTVCFQKKEGKYVFVLPKSKKAIVAFVSKLIYEFYASTQQLEGVLTKLFPELNPKARFTAFVEQVLNPYREAFRSVFMYDENVEQSESDEEDIGVNPALITEIYSATAVIRGSLDGDNKVTDSQRKEIYEVIDALCYAIETNQSRFVRSSWCGLKLLLNSKRYKADMDRLEETLTTYMLI